jgi:hypothetical protein
MITKAEAVSKLADEEEAERALWEKKIDAALKRHTDRTFVDSSGLSRRVRDRLVADYQRKGGWHVEEFDDQRDGPSLVFS